MPFVVGPNTPIWQAPGVTGGGTSVAWNPIRYPVNKFMLAGSWSPGICRGPTNAAIVRNLDERQGYGIDFAWLIFWGRKLARFTMTLELYTEQDWDDWQKWRPLVHTVPRRGPVRRSTDNADTARSMLIWHPQLAPLGITSAIVEEEPQEEVDDGMIAKVPIRFAQCKGMPKPAYAKPEAAKEDPALTAQEQRIRNKAEQLMNALQQDTLAGKR